MVEFYFCAELRAGFGDIERWSKKATWRTLLNFRTYTYMSRTIHICLEQTCFGLSREHRKEECCWGLYAEKRRQVTAACFDSMSDSRGNDWLKIAKLIVFWRRQDSLHKSSDRARVIVWLCDCRRLTATQRTVVKHVQQFFVSLAFFDLRFYILWILHAN